MGSEAQKEPTMEEILASIRRIIAEDDQPAGAPAKAEAKTPASFPLEDEPVADYAGEADGADDFDSKPPVFDPSAFEDGATEGVAGEEEDEAEPFDTEEFEAFESEDFTPDLDDEIEEEVEAVTEPEPAIEIEAFEDEFGEEEVEPAFETPAIEPEPVPAFEDFETIEDEDDDPVEETVAEEDEFEYEEAPAGMAPPEDELAEEADMPAPVRSAAESLTDETAATAAAAAMSKLLARAEKPETAEPAASQAKTVEDLVRETLKPMLKAWLDENLLRIVSEKVEEEVARISRRVG